MYKTDANDILIVNCDDLYCLEEKVKNAKMRNACRPPAQLGVSCDGK